MQQSHDQATLSSPIAPISFKLLLIKKNGSDSSGISFIFCNNTHFTHNTSSTTRKHSVPWIIDSRATYHIASFLKCFSSYSKINPIQINLPNKSIVTAYISGTIIFSPNFILHNVLFVPEFHFKMFNIHCRGIHKVLGRFEKKTAKKKKQNGGELVKHGGYAQESSSRTL